MNDEESSRSAELNSYHGAIDPSLSTGLGGFVIAHQSSLTHQPAEGAFHDPTAWQDGEASGSVGAFDDFDGMTCRQLRPATSGSTAIKYVRAICRLMAGCWCDSFLALKIRCAAALSRSAN